MALGSTPHRAVSRALSFFVLTHALGLLSMATLLRGGMDAVALSAADRMAYVAQNPWLWRLGWLPWQLSALSDLLVSTALVAWLYGRPGRAGLGLAVAALLLTIVAAVPEQWAEAQLVTRFVNLAASGDISAFDVRWGEHLWVTGVWAGLVYTLMLACWMGAIRAGTGRGAWSGRAEAALFTCFAFGGLGTHLAATDPVHRGAWFAVGGALNAIAFNGMNLWALAAGGRIGAAIRDAERSAAPADRPVRWPDGRRFARVAFLTMAGVRDVLRPLSKWLSSPRLRRQVEDVVLVQWVVPTERAVELVPAELSGELRGDSALLSLLVFRSVPRAKRWMGSLGARLAHPVHALWLLRLGPPARGDATVVTGAVNHPLNVLLLRLVYDALPVHLPSAAAHERDGRGTSTQVASGTSSATDLRCEVRNRETDDSSAHFAAFDGEASLAPLEARSELSLHRPLPPSGLSSRLSWRFEPKPGSLAPAELVDFEARELGEVLRGCPVRAFTAERGSVELGRERWMALASLPLRVEQHRERD